MIAIAFTVAAALWAAVLTILGTAVLNRLTRRRRTAREPETPERPLARAAAAAAAWLVPLRMARVLEQRSRPASRRRQPAGTAHEGATEAFGPELRALRDAPVAPELVTAVETELRWAQIWIDFEHDLRVQVDEIFDPLLSALKEPLDAQTCIRLDSAAWQTGEWSLVPNDLALTGVAL